MLWMDVLIEAIDLDRSRADLDSLRREVERMSLLSHPNILKPHCSFTVDRCLWIILPFMSAGSLQSVIASAFPAGLDEPCIAVVLKEALSALSYLHGEGHLHMDIKAANILIDSNGSVKLAGVSAADDELGSASTAPAPPWFIEGSPYWVAPEVIHSHSPYTSKADIWSLGITALELAHGRPPLSHLPPSVPLINKITNRFGSCSFENIGESTSSSKEFSKSFKGLVVLCLNQDPAKRPPAKKLLTHPFFKNCEGTDFLAKNLLQGLPSVEQRYKESMTRWIESMKIADKQETARGKPRRINWWNLNGEAFLLDPVFPIGNEETEDVGGGGLDCSYAPGDVEALKRRIVTVRKSVEEQKNRVNNLVARFGGYEEMPAAAATREEEVRSERVRSALAFEKKRAIDLEKELEFLMSQLKAQFEAP